MLRLLSPLWRVRIVASMQDRILTDDQDGSCLDDTRISRSLWRVACGRVQVMSPAFDICGTRPLALM